MVRGENVDVVTENPISGRLSNQISPKFGLKIYSMETENKIKIESAQYYMNSQK